MYARMRLPVLELWKVIMCVAYRLVFTCLVVSIILMRMGGSGSAEDADVLQLQYETKLPVAAISAAWSPDGKKLLVNLPYIRSLALGNEASVVVDVEKKSVGKLQPTVGSGLDDFVWSPDGKYVAMARISTLELRRFPDFESIAELRAKPSGSDGRCAFAEKVGVQFTSDGRHLWVACGIYGYDFSKRHSELLMAVKVSVPDFEIVDRLVVPNPEPRKRVSARHYMTRQGDKILLNSVLQVYGEKPAWGYQYASCFLMDAKAPCYSMFKVNELGVVGGIVYAPIYSTNKQLAAMAIRGPIRTPDGRKIEKPTEELSLFDRTSDKPIRTFRPSKESGVAGFGAPTFLGNQDYLIMNTALTKTDRRSKLRTALGVWRTNDLRLVQLIDAPGSPSSSFRSPDGSRLATIDGKDLRIYRLSGSAEGADRKQP